MKVFKIRYGFATNSSSSHSILFYKDEEVPCDYDVDGCDFGWQNFTASSKVAKALYLSQIVMQSLRYLLSEKSWGCVPEESKIYKSIVFNLVTPGLNHKEKMQLHEKFDPEGYIDHQSIITLPLNWNQKFIDLKFFADFREYLYLDNVVILGGNDNEDPHPLRDSTKEVDIPIVEIGISVARKDDNYWSVFNRVDGKKTRFTFDDLSNEKDFVPTKASVPELIDIKITNFCDSGCEFCYQDSKPDGLHSKIEYSLLSSLEELKVFEVALGGGEPTKHPEFISIVKQFRHHGIVPNFSTRSLDWLRDSKQWIPIMENIGGFAYSVRSVQELDEFISLLTINGIRPGSEKVSVQYVMGSTDPWMFEAILERVYQHSMRITLLDFKPVGRGKDFPYFEYKDWFKSLKILSKEGYFYYKVGIDTPLAAKFEKELLEAGVSEESFETKEGKFSMYIDATTGMCGPSSFCPKEQMIQLAEKCSWSSDLRYTAESIKKVFAGFEKTPPEINQE